MTAKHSKLIFLITYLAYTAIYIARVNLSMAGPGLIEAGVLDTVQMGTLGSIFSTVYSVGRLLNGGISDRQPPWRMLTTGLALAGISNLLFSFFPPFFGLFLLWTSNAYAQSMLWSSVLCVVASLYDKETAKKKTSFMVTSVAMGNILGIILNTFLITRFGVKFAFIVPGILTVVLGVLVFFATGKIQPVAETAAKKHISMWQLLKSRELAFMSVPALMHGVMKENISLWMTVFIVDRYQVDLSTSSYYILLIPLIGFVGRTVYPVIYSLSRNRENRVSLLGFLVCLVAAVLLCFGKIPMLAAILALSIIYTAASVINTSILSIYPLHYLKTGNVASVSGIMDFATYLGAGISGVIYGVAIKNFGYIPMFVSWAVISVISIAFLMKIESDRKVQERIKA